MDQTVQQQQQLKEEAYVPTIVRRFKEPRVLSVLDRRIAFVNDEDGPMYPMLKDWVANDPSRIFRDPAAGRPASLDVVSGLERSSSNSHPALPPPLPHNEGSRMQLTPVPNPNGLKKSQLLGRVAAGLPAPTVRELREYHFAYWRDLRQWYALGFRYRTARHAQRLALLGVEVQSAEEVSASAEAATAAGGTGAMGSHAGDADPAAAAQLDHTDDPHLAAGTYWPHASIDDPGYFGGADGDAALFAAPPEDDAAHATYDWASEALHSGGGNVDFHSGGSASWPAAERPRKGKGGGKRGGKRGGKSRKADSTVTSESQFAGPDYSASGSSRLRRFEGSEVSGSSMEGSAAKRAKGAQLSAAMSDVAAVYDQIHSTTGGFAERSGGEGDDLAARIGAELARASSDLFEASPSALFEDERCLHHSPAGTGGGDDRMPRSLTSASSIGGAGVAFGGSDGSVAARPWEGLGDDIGDDEDTYAVLASVAALDDVGRDHLPRAPR